LEEIGGYSSQLREAGFEGCEDFSLQLAIASRYRFAVVPEYLVGYRSTGTNMSSDRVRMARSQSLVLDDYLARCGPAAALAIREAILRNDCELFIRAFKRGQGWMAAQTFSRIARNRPSVLLHLAWRIQTAAFRMVLSRRKILAPVEQFSESSEALEPFRSELCRTMTALKKVDDELGPHRAYLCRPTKPGSPK
jgi:hypothetical protein